MVSVQANLSNYVNIEQALAQLISAYTGLPGEIGDFSKITLSTPNFVVQHARGNVPRERQRHPNYEDLDWFFPVHLFFDYESDAEAHKLFAFYRVLLIHALMEHPLLDISGIGSYPQNQDGHAKDSQLIQADLVGYFSLDEKAYAQGIYVVWVQERVFRLPGGTPAH